MTINNVQAELSEAMAFVARQLNQVDPNWLLGGSCGLLLQGVKLDRPPRDIDVYANMDGIDKLHEALSNYALDTPSLDEEGMYLSMLSHYEVNHIPLELIGGFKVRAYGSVYQIEVDGLLYPLAPETALGDISFRLMPLAHELVFNVLRDRPDRYNAISEAIKLQPEQHHGTLNRIIDSNVFNPDHLTLIRELAGLKREDPQDV